jgi:cytosine/adenosine deaminase-related metal-dependent hydrolase
MIEDSAVVIHQNSIAAVGQTGRIIENYPEQRVYGFRDSVLMRGLINVHTHLVLPP